MIRAMGILLLLLGGCVSTPPWAGEYRVAAVASDHAVASAAGDAILRQGGNAVDAAVATSFCLAVVRPYSCGLGGGGFMVIHDPGVDAGIAITYRETAPAAMHPAYFASLEPADGAPPPSRWGVHAVGVPGTVAGLLEALDCHGTLNRATVLAPAIRAAEEGFPVDADHLDAVAFVRDRLEEHPRLTTTAGWIWTNLCGEGSLKVGDRLRQPALARTLRRIADRGADGFYHGPVAEAVARVVAEGGGPMTAADLASYRVRHGVPLRAEGVLGRYTVLAMPPPSSGGVAMLQVLGIVHRRWEDLGRPGPGSPEWVHLLAEAMQHAFADRAEYLADDAFVPVPVADLLDPAYLATLAGRLDPVRTLDRFDYGSTTPAPADAGTSHLCVVDARGMAVACTETINTPFGSLMAVPAWGIVLNNEVDDFTTVPGAPNFFGLHQSDRNLPAPGKRPLSSMSPTIVLENGAVVLVAGASGGPRIITGTLQVLLNVLLHGMDLPRAIAAPRLHHQWVPGELQLEDRWTDARLVAALERRGHVVTRRPAVGKVQAIVIHGTHLHAASDPRKGGRPAGH